MFIRTSFVSLGLITLLVAVPAWADSKSDTGDKVGGAARSAAKDTGDAWVTAKAKIALYADSRVSGTSVTVDTKRGVVTLRGKVDSAEAKAAADESVKAVEGVKEIKNQLQIVAPARREMVDAKDDYIKDRVEKMISKDSHLKEAKIDVRSDSGVVMLTGKAPDWMASARASELARKVDGVKSVKNSLEIQK